MRIVTPGRLFAVRTVLRDPRCTKANGPPKRPPRSFGFKRNRLARAGELKAVSGTLFSQTFNLYIDTQHLFELRRTLEFTLHGDSRPTDYAFGIAHHHTKPHVP